MKLTPKQERFVAEYLIDLNATQAAIRSGYSVKTASSQGERLLRNVEVAKAITVAQKAREQRTEITQDRVLKELAKLGFANMQDYMSITKEGEPFADLSKLSRDQAAAITEFTVEDFTEGRGDDARDVRRVKFKLADKRAALVDIGKHLGMFKEKVELTGANGGPVETVSRVTRTIVDPKA
jgi:phage terminase small subunit